MPPQIPGYVETFEFVFRAMTVASVLLVFWIGTLHGASSSRYVTASVLSAALLAWMVVAWRLGAAGTYFDTQRPILLLALALPLILAAAGFRLSKSAAQLFAAVPLWLLVAVQVFRVGGGIFLVLWVAGRLPWQFALAAGLGDVATGVAAVVVAVLLARKSPGALRAAYGWSLFGIADLVVAVTLGAMTSPGQIHVLALDSPNLLVTSYPLVMVPTFAVPLYLLLHGLVLWRLRREVAAIGKPAFQSQAS